MSGNLVHTFFGKKTCGTFFAFVLSPLFEVDAKKLDLNACIHGVSPKHRLKSHFIRMS